MRRKGIRALSIVSMIIAFWTVVVLWGGLARADGRTDGDCHSEVTDQGPSLPLGAQMTEAVIRLQPRYVRRPEQARDLVQSIIDAAYHYDQEPWIALALGFKESSLHPSVGRLARRGRLGELGYFQLMPRGAPYRRCGRGRDMADAYDNALAAMCWLNHVQDLCGTDDPWQYIAAYSMNRCPRPKEGRRIRAARMTRLYLSHMVGDAECERLWPTNSSV